MHFSDAEEKILIYAALLHDIGKLNYSKDRKHQISGIDFLEVLSGLSDNERNKIKYLIENHHICREMGIRSPDEIKDTLLRILIKSDGLSSAERIDEKEEEEKGDRYKEPLLTPFSEIKLRSRNADRRYYSMHILTAKKGKFGYVAFPNIYPKEKEDAIKESRKETKEEGIGRSLLTSYESISEELKNSLTNVEDINTLLYLLKKYTQFVPSATYKEIPDIPLYDHLKTTAAIALCLYRTKESDTPFLLIEGDLSGIQSFIFDHFREIDAHKQAAKRLRGRSFYINLLIDAVIFYIQEKLGLFEFNVLWRSGGNFVILAPNKEEYINFLSEMRRNVNKFLFDNGINLYLNLSWVKGKREDIVDFASFLKRLHIENEKSKLHKYSDIFCEGFVKTEERNLCSDKELCPVCGRNKVKPEEGRRECELCEKLKEMGAEIVKTDLIKRCLNPIQKDSTTISFKFDENFKVGYFPIDKKNATTTFGEKEFIWHINSFDYIAGKAFNIGQGTLLIGNYAPHKGDKLLSFDEIVDCEEDISRRKSEDNKGKPSKLALLKADVDNLGLIFSFGFEKDLRKISRITFLSFLFDWFFSIEINKLAKEKNIYVLFYGGDDLVVAGRYDEIVEFARDFYDKFRKYVACNPDINFSAGIALSHYKFPIRRLLDYAKYNLNESKDKGKERITIFDETVVWEEFKEHLKLSEKLIEYIKRKKLGKGFLHVLLKLRSKCFKDIAKEGEKVICCPEPYLRYILIRNTKDKELTDNLIEEILREEKSNGKDINIFKHIKLCVSYVSLLLRYKT